MTDFSALPIGTRVFDDVLGDGEILQNPKAYNSIATFPVYVEFRGGIYEFYTKDGEIQGSTRPTLHLERPAWLPVTDKPCPQCDGNPIYQRLDHEDYKKVTCQTCGGEE